MSFRDFKDQVKKCVIDSLAINDLPKLRFEPIEPPRPEYGDLSVSVCITIANKTGKKPTEVAEKVASKIKISDNSIIDKISVHQQGYINFTNKYTKYAYQTLRNVLDNSDYGRVQIGNDDKVGIEHTSVNPNKALHYGHLRNVVLGDSIKRILEFTGHNVQILNYIDDSGLQVADLVVGFRQADFPLEPTGNMKFDQYCGDIVYVKINEMYNSRKDLIEAQKKVLQKIEQQESEIAKFSHKITRLILKEQLKTCWRIGARYDLLNFESHILQTNMWNDIFSQLKSKTLVEKVSNGKNNGCWIVRIKGEKEGEEKVLLRSDGTATYMAKDIPYAAWKLGIIKDKFGYKIFSEQPAGVNLWSTTTEQTDANHPEFAPYSKSITVIDVRQGRLQRIIAMILSNLAEKEDLKRYIHLGYEVVFLSGKTAEEIGVTSERKEIVSMSGRKGIYVNADDVLDKLHRRAFEETKKRNPDETDDWLHETAEKIMVAAVRFDLLKQDLEKTIVFDLNHALALEGETGPYLQYTYARATRIIEKSGITSSIKSEYAKKLTDSSEIALIKEISKFDLIVEDAANNLAPKIVARYLFHLVSLFNAFYEKIPVLKEKDEDTKLGRIAMIKAFQVVVRNGLQILGINATEKI